jgi:hypothetical protein
MTSSLEKFISEIRTGGVARPNRFSVEITKPLCMSTSPTPGVEELPKLISLYCQSASIPGQNIGVRDLRITGPTYKRPINIDYGGEGIALTFFAVTHETFPIVVTAVTNIFNFVIGKW